MICRRVVCVRNMAQGQPACGAAAEPQGERRVGFQCWGHGSDPRTDALQCLQPVGRQGRTLVSITDINSLACGHARVHTGSGDGGGQCCKPAEGHADGRRLQEGAEKTTGLFTPTLGHLGEVGTGCHAPHGKQPPGFCSSAVHPLP